MPTNVVASPTFSSKVFESSAITDSIARFDGKATMASSTYNVIASHSTGEYTSIAVSVLGRYSLEYR